MKRPTPAKTKLAAKEIGESIATWRKLQNLTAQQLADKANISRATLSRLENGDSNIAFTSILNICNALGITRGVIDAMDPFESDYGRLRAGQELPKRVRS